MAIQPPQSLKWPADRALLFVHGIGSSKVGDYDPIVAQLRDILGADSAKFAIYFLYYDAVNEWFAQKLQAQQVFTKLVQFISGRLDGSELGNAAAAFAGDVVWPVLIPDARLAIRAAMLQQLQTIVLDGIAAGVQPRNQHISIIAHSLGCFHTYEALSRMATAPAEGLGPASAGVVLDNVIYMASPVQLIRSSGLALGNALPQPSSIFSVSDAALEIPSEPGDDGAPVRCARRTVSITGNLDPVGGFVFRAKQPWGYMNLPDQESFIDQEQVATVNGSERFSLASILVEALQTGGPPTIAPENPHDWSAYVARHAADLRTWLT
ncbi:MAG: hypothetical protein JWL61_1168 [Gemmatimonadetes bacterium]|jgi:hypothetical protein|nr:hypothetical protein [Gemmatimonadota bacterium]